jgi:hypothetical protein
LTNIDLKYNAFSVKTDLLINGKDATLRCFGTGKDTLIVAWIDDFFLEVIKKCNLGSGSECSVQFYGTQSDFELVRNAYEEYTGKNTGIKIDLLEYKRYPQSLDEINDIIEKQIVDCEGKLNEKSKERENCVNTLNEKKKEIENNKDNELQNQKKSFNDLCAFLSKAKNETEKFLKDEESSFSKKISTTEYSIRLFPLTNNDTSGSMYERMITYIKDKISGFSFADKFMSSLTHDFDNEKMASIFFSEYKIFSKKIIDYYYSVQEKCNKEIDKVYDELVSRCKILLDMDIFITRNDIIKIDIIPLSFDEYKGLGKFIKEYNSCWPPAMSDRFWQGLGYFTTYLEMCQNKMNDNLEYIISLMKAQISEQVKNIISNFTNIETNILKNNGNTNTTVTNDNESKLSEKALIDCNTEIAKINGMISTLKEIKDEIENLEAR